MRLHHRERDPVLVEYVRHRKLAAKRIAAVRKVHFSDLVGVRLHQNGHVRVLQGRHRAVLVDEDGHTQNDAVVLAFMAFQPVVILPPFLARFHRAVAGGVFVHDKRFVPRVRHRLDHVCAGSRDQLPRA